jgi:hypothetical protein
MSGKGKAVLAALVTISAFAVSCGKDSNSVAAPTNSVNAMSVAGTWSGTYTSNSTSCAAAPMTITIQQNGSTLTGQVTTMGGVLCGPHGGLKGTISGNMVTGNIDMQGCTGGGISGQVSNGVFSLSIGDFYKTLVTAPNVVMQGGVVTLRQ